MEELGRLEDLPQEYRDELVRNNLVPLWPSLRSVMPPLTPKPRTQPILWTYDSIRPLLLRAGGPMLDRRVDQLLEAWGQGPWIFNLGHGILPDVPIAHVEQVLRRIGAQ